MSSLYTQFGTDKDAEQKGIILAYGNNSKGNPIEIRIARAGGSNQRYLKRLEALTKPHRRAIQTETIEKSTIEDIMLRVYAETVVIGWEGVEDRSGNPLDFTLENVTMLLKDLPDLLADIQEQAQKVALFREELLEADSKN